MVKDTCPLYEEAQEAAPQRNADRPNAGLVFDKFADAWHGLRADQQGTTLYPQFDPPGARDDNHTGGWLQRTLPARFQPDRGLLSEFCQRQADLAVARGGGIFRLTNVERFVTGLGQPHPAETGFRFHPVLGVPYLPGSGVKGVIRAWLREREGEWSGARCAESERALTWFGDLDRVGELACLDLVPTHPPTLEVDIMTPHYGPYYRQGDTPGDWHSPVPIPFLTVAPATEWQLGLTPGGRRSPISADEWQTLTGILEEALYWLGAGAKTAVGYGAFHYDARNTAKANRERAERLREQRRRRQRERELARMAADEAELERRAEAEGWDSDKSAFIRGVDAYLAEYPAPSPRVIESLRQRFERFYGGIWDNPDKPKGKHGKSYYFKEKPRALVARLKEIARQQGAT